MSSAVIVYFGPDLVSEVTDRSYIRLLSWPMKFVQEAALEKLAERRSGRALPRMIDMFRGRERLATQSSEAVARFGEVAVPALIEAARDPDPRLRYWAVRTLGDIGEAAGAAKEVLVASLHDPVAIVRHSALTALPEVECRAAVEALTEFLSFDGSDTLGRIIAIQVLESLGRQAASALPVLEKLIEESDQVERVKEFAARAVQTLIEDRRAVKVFDKDT